MATVFDDISSVPPSQSCYFETVSSNLLRLGALTLEDFLRDPYQEPAPQENNFLSNPLYHDAPLALPLFIEDKDGEGKPSQTAAPIFVLHQICSQTFGSIDALNYEIIEEDGKQRKRCILTITRPNGATRSYTSKPEFIRKAEARAAAAAVAVDMGAIDFIKNGSPEAVAKRGLVLAPLDAPGSVQEPSPMDAQEDPGVKEIETCCVEWRAGRVKPRWIFLIDSKPIGKYGCALQVKLSLHLFRVFSVDVVHPTFEEAKAACAADAISEGILDFIKFGNGQMAPTEKRHFQPQEDDANSAAPPPPPPIALTLQGFFEALPRPLPEPVDDKTVSEINAPGWLNTLIQSARGAKFELKFIWTTDTKLGTHGAVLRLVRPGEVRTYLVDPQFPKRADAKNAVCLVALSAGVGAYVRSIAEALEIKVPPETRTLVFETILPLLTGEYAKFWPNKLPVMFEYTKDRDAIGCVLTLKLKEPPEEHENRSWTVPADYRSRNDAKVAVVLHAFEQGAIEFLRFPGAPPSEGYKVELPPPREPKKAKRKCTDGAEKDGKNPKKKPKLPSQAEQFLSSTKPSRSQVASAEPILLPRPGYVDSKPEPGELPPDSLPARPPEHTSPVNVNVNVPRRQAFKQSRDYPPRRHEASSLDHYPPGERRRSWSNGARGHGHHPYEFGVTRRYDDSGLYAAPDPYHAPHMEPWHAVCPSAPVYPEERRYGFRPDYRIDYGPGPSYDDYQYGAAPLLPPSQMPEPAARGGYGGGNDDYAHGQHGYSSTHHHPPSRAHAHRYSQQQQQQPPPSLSSFSSSYPGPSPPSPPRIWEPGPHAAKVDSRRSNHGRPPKLLLPTSVAPTTAEVAPAPAPGSASSLSSFSSSSSSSSSSLPTAARQRICIQPLRPHIVQ